MATEVNLGGHPAWNIAKASGMLFGVTVFVVCVALLMNKIVGIIVGLLLGLLWTFALGPTLLGKLIAASINSRVYKEAGKLIAEGKLVAGYFGRNLSCEGLAVVDEQNKRLYLNGHLYDFGDIKSIQPGWITKRTETKHYVEIIVKHGAAPMQKVWFDGEHAATTFCHRLGNNLGFA